eukprot:3394997-Prymnesium_polylepis.1
MGCVGCGRRSPGDGGRQGELHRRVDSARHVATPDYSSGRWPMLWPMADVVARGGIGRLRVPR